MKRFVIVPVELESSLNIEIVTELNSKTLDGVDCLLCTKAEVIKELKRILLDFGIAEGEI